MKLDLNRVGTYDIKFLLDALALRWGNTYNYGRLSILEDYTGVNASGNCGGKILLVKKMWFKKYLKYCQVTHAAENRIVVFGWQHYNLGVEIKDLLVSVYGDKVEIEYRYLGDGRNECSEA